MKEIYPIGADTNDVAFDIDDNNQVIGQSFNVNTGLFRAFLWQNNVINDLNALVVQPTSLYLTLAQGINDSGEISGSAIDTSTGEIVGFLAVPVSNGSGTPPSKAPEWKDLSKLVSPESVRQLLERQPGLAGVVARAMATK
jgi:probable HAF family extracellular repeat protein